MNRHGGAQLPLGLGREVNAIDAVAVDYRTSIDERYPGGSSHMRVG